MSKIRDYIRRDNWRRWGPMFLDLLGVFSSPLVSVIFGYHPVLYWILVGVSVFFLFLFLLSVYKYVDEWHGIVHTLCQNEPSLHKAIFLLAAMRSPEKGSDRASHQLINKSIVVKKATIKYLFEDNPYSIADVCYYPFSVEYSVKATVKQDFRTLYFYTLGHKASKTITGIETTINGVPVQNTPESCLRDIKRIEFNAKSTISKGNNAQGSTVDFTIKIPYKETYGLVSGKNQSFIFYPTNISPNYDEHAHIHVELVFPLDLYKNYLEKEFEIKQIDYTNSFTIDPQNRGHSFTDSANETCIVRSFDLSAPKDDLSGLSIIKFRKKQT